MRRDVECLLGGISSLADVLAEGDYALAETEELGVYELLKAEEDGTTSGWECPGCNKKYTISFERKMA